MRDLLRSVSPNPHISRGSQALFLAERVTSRGALPRARAYKLQDIEGSDRGPDPESGSDPMTPKTPSSHFDQTPGRESDPRRVIIYILAALVCLVVGAI